MKFHWYFLLIYTLHFVLGISLIIPLSNIATTSLSLYNKYTRYTTYTDNWLNNKIYYNIGKYNFFSRNCINNENLKSCNNKNTNHDLILKKKDLLIYLKTIQSF